LKKDDVIVYESTVYPGCTEEECVPLLEKISGLKYNEDFFCGYSPERVNPGDRVNTVDKIVKVVSGSTPQTADFIEQLYGSIIDAGTYRTSSIKVAEAAKAIEIAQRDVNISFVNELALIFDRMGLDTAEVLEAAATKWNFLKFTPGLVGGHCISVDPYYLLHKSQSLGYNPQVILSGRSVNDEMGRFVAQKTIKLMIAHGIRILDSRALVLGFTFKENCPDTRNTKVIDVINEIRDYGVNVDVYDPRADAQRVNTEYGITLLADSPVLTDYDAVILAVPHEEFRSFDFGPLAAKNAVIFDVKGLLPKDIVHGRL
ncbi:MAG: nucleotide sugar dehydrogenase, partial [Tannerella sp.]|nr:nucleotide sugar dehydrogenase [Tannerella sp.]